jgi:hypothetical protein
MTKNGDSFTVCYSTFQSKVLKVPICVSPQPVCTALHRTALHCTALDPLARETSLGIFEQRRTMRPTQFQRFQLVSPSILLLFSKASSKILCTHRGAKVRMRAVNELNECIYAQIRQRGSSRE